MRDDFNNALSEARRSGATSSVTPMAGANTMTHTQHNTRSKRKHTKQLKRNRKNKATRLARLIIAIHERKVARLGVTP